MLILSLDTSSASGSAAVWRDGVVIAEREGDGTRTHGERLPRELMAVLDVAGATLHEVDRFAVCTGPGSFTGLRVGIATMQGLALAQHKLIVPVSAFEAMALDLSQASDAGPSGAIAIWIDAHRGEVFAILYGADGRTVLHEPTSLAPAGTLDAWIASGALPADAAVHFAGDGALRYQDIIRERLPDPRVPPFPGSDDDPRLPRAPRQDDDLRVPRIPRPDDDPRVPRIPRPDDDPRVPRIPRPDNDPRLPRLPRPEDDPRVPRQDDDSRLPRPGLLAGTIAMIAGGEQARAVSPHAVAPLYIRRPDAELARDRRNIPTAPQGQP